MRHCRLFAIAAALMLAAGGASAATYYVDCDAGSDSRDGTSRSTAWRTLGKARDSASSSQEHRVLVEGQCGAVTFSQGRSAWLRFEALDPSSRPSLVGGAGRIVVSGNNSVKISFKGFDLVASTNVTSGQGLITLDGLNSDFELIDSVLRSSSCASNFSPGDAVYMKNGAGDGTLFDGNEIACMARALMYNDTVDRGANGGKRTTIRNNHIHDLARTAINMYDGNMYTIAHDNLIATQWPCGYQGCVTCTPNHDHGSGFGVLNKRNPNLSTFGAKIFRNHIQDFGNTGPIYFYAGATRNVEFFDNFIDGGNIIQWGGTSGNKFNNNTVMDITAFILKPSSGADSSNEFYNNVIYGQVKDPNDSCGRGLWSAGNNVIRKWVTGTSCSSPANDGSDRIGSAHFDDSSGAGCAMFQNCPIETNSCSDNADWDPGRDFDDAVRPGSTAVGHASSSRLTVHPDTGSYMDRKKQIRNASPGAIDAGSRSTSGSGSTDGQPTWTALVDAIDPAGGVAPISGVDVMASASGTAAGPVVWEVDCDGSDGLWWDTPGDQSTPNSCDAAAGAGEASCRAIEGSTSENSSHTFMNACSFSSAGSSHISVRSTRESVASVSTRLFIADAASLPRVALISSDFSQGTSDWVQNVGSWSVSGERLQGPASDLGVSLIRNNSGVLDSDDQCATLRIVSDSDSAPGVVLRGKTGDLSNSDRYDIYVALDQCSVPGNCPIVWRTYGSGISVAGSPEGSITGHTMTLPTYLSACVIGGGSATKLFVFDHGDVEPVTDMGEWDPAFVGSIAKATAYHVDSGGFVGIRNWGSLSSQAPVLDDFKAFSVPDANGQLPPDPDPDPLGQPGRPFIVSP